MDDLASRPEISVILPCYDEEENLPLLLPEIQEVLKAVGRPWELIVIDDASTDGTLSVLRTLKASCPQLRVLTHARRQREASALITGMIAARGQLLVTMDADLQHDPHAIPGMLELLEREKADAVCPVRPRREHSLLKRLASRTGNAVRTCVLRDGVRDSGYTFRIVKRDALLEMPRFLGLHRFLPGLLLLHGFRIHQPEVPQRPRRHGKSKYGVLNRLGPGVLDLVGMLWYRHRSYRRGCRAGEDTLAHPAGSAPATTPRHPPSTIQGTGEDT